MTGIKGGGLLLVVLLLLLLVKIGHAAHCSKQLLRLGIAVKLGPGAAHFPAADIFGAATVELGRAGSLEVAL